MITKEEIYGLMEEIKKGFEPIGYGKLLKEEKINLLIKVLGEDYDSSVFEWISI